MLGAPSSANPITLITGVALNETALQFWHYTLYHNGTLSNGSHCFLAFGVHKPIVFANGTFTNTTSCYSPINPIGARGITGLVFGSLFALTILFSTINLRKHGRAYLPRERGWKPVGRRWPWYWTLIVAACGILGSFTAVDVDRDYIINTPMILQSFFLTLMVPVLLACVWEAVRSWSSFNHRQFQEAQSYTFSADTFHDRATFYLPLLFYAFDCLVFFMLIPRSWSFAQRQRSPAQALESARPAALDARFKAASILATACLGLVVFRLGYGSRTHKTKIPVTLLLTIIAVALRTAYGLVGSWVWELSPYRRDLSVGLLYGLGYAPALFVLVFLNIHGYINENEDKLLIAQRASRGEELGEGSAAAMQQSRQHHSRRPPSWWFRSRNRFVSTSGVFKMPTSSRRPPLEEVSQAVHTNRAEEQDESGYAWWQRRRREEEDARHLKPRQNAHSNRSAGSSMLIKGDTLGIVSQFTEPESLLPPPRYQRETPYEYSKDSRSQPASSTHSLQSPPQVVKSMLDV
ncbi:uncharacterized protein Z520_01190 [Fonsecaea multimorphosa CBS 102226]|uniref:Uncharacterized protein n=1 Tax=Fonsecaea multimorphosa CBS 102226 TaxID=1442371 RepID=A0A0D2KGX0_9EURO|nr:uncharacterized protein Z520_01190 [Fonsecaea multimorphosa CBS 102226]KIY02725.1 hypothetical protein Z520_01190 [Fonsecaea multimorphosa CBS 102226]OAL31586.1 hypothetical protein AYO22_01178 [Fonsecaea multimorphosa]